MNVAVTAGLEPLALLDELVRIPSVTGEVDVAAARLLEVAADAGFDTHRDDAGNVVMTWGEGAAADEILLLGHLDTVPGEIAVRHHGGRLHGRGTVDAKGPLVAALTAVSRLPRDAGRRVTVIAACDEEGASLGARHLRSRVAPAHLVVLEPSGWDTITTGYRGCVRLTATVCRVTAHHAGPLAGAADVLVTLLGELQRSLHRDADRAVDRVQMRVNTLHTHDDGTSERADAAIEVRLPVGVTVDDVLTRLSGLLDGADVEFASACEPVQVSRGNPVARALARAVTGAGGRPRYTTKTGTSDLNVVLPAWGCPAAVYGPGDCSLDHTPRESIDVGELCKGADVLEAAVRSLR
ncbi:MAG TPA: M20/M25/M40 family metallo-hydrolase [Candidatus Dormibacteraeota bacterium]|nr:M20/M25/M40 family metallo-hydrolase [Candidatus Dormibacteraeota bacterium]